MKTTVNVNGTNNRWYHTIDHIPIANSNYSLLALLMFQANTGWKTFCVQCIPTTVFGTGHCHGTSHCCLLCFGVLSWCWYHYKSHGQKDKHGNSIILLLCRHSYTSIDSTVVGCVVNAFCLVLFFVRDDSI